MANIFKLVSSGTNRLTMDDSSGLTINNGGLTVTAGGLTVTAGGATVTAGGLAVTAGGLTVGGGTSVTGMVIYSQTITPASVGAATVAEQTFTVTGLATTDKVFVNHAAFGNATGIAGVRVSAANTLAVSFVNPTAGALTPAAGTWKIIALRSA